MAEKTAQKDTLASNPKPLEKLNHGFAKPDASFKADEFYGWYDQLQKLAATDVSSKSGLETILTIVGNSDTTKTWDSSTIASAKNDLVKLATGELSQYSIKNAPDLASVIPSSTQIQYFMDSSCFETKEDTKYQEIVSAKRKLEQTERDIEERPQEYIEARLKGLDDRAKSFWIQRAQQLISSTLESLKNYTVGLLVKYGPAKAIGKNISVGDKTVQAYQKAQMKIAESMKKDVDAKMREVATKEGTARKLTAAEENDIFGKYKPEQEKLNKQYEATMPAISSFDKQVQTLEAISFGALKKKKEEAEKSKKEKEAKKK